MGVTATLSDRRVTRARVDLPESGLWFAEVEIDKDDAMTGPVVLKISDLTLRGTILSGGIRNGRSSFRIVAGAGGWGKLLKERPYQNDGGVKLSTIIGDAALEAGEQIAPINPKLTAGPAWNRVKDEPASRVLERTVPNAWYVDEDGILQLGKRLSTKLPPKVTRVTPIDYARRTVELSSDSIVAIVPGVTIDDLKAVDVRHEISAESGLRTKVWGSSAGGVSRELDALRRLLDQLDPDRAFRDVVEFRVVSQSGNRLNLQPVRVSTGMPPLSNVRVRPGVSGAKSTVASGELVLVAFIESDPARPVVIGHADADASGHVPTSTSLFATMVSVGDDAATAIAHSAETVASLQALLVELTALNVWLNAAIVANVGTFTDPGATLTSTLVTATTTAIASITAQLATLPTIKVKGT